MNDIVNLAFDATCGSELRHELLRRVVVSTRSFGGVLADPQLSVTGHSVCGLPVDDVERARAHWAAPVEVSGLRPLFDALAVQRVVTDTKVFSPAEYERLAVRPIMAGLGIRSAISSLFPTGGGRMMFLALACDQRETDPRTEAYVATLVPALALACAAVASPPAEIVLPHWLTDRQREICMFVLQGHTNAEIARACGISLNTVRNHLVKLFKAFAVSTRTELAAQLLLAPRPPRTVGRR